MTPEREAFFREQAEACENADPTEIRELCDAIAALRSQRNEANRQLFDLKAQVRSFMESLQSSTEEVLRVL
jgi:uncharacterized coiled-coil DUF342 family protein